MHEQSLSAIDDLRILEVRGHTVVLDSDLAAIYGVETKVFNQAIRRNTARFPADFLFRLTAEEWMALASRIVTLKGSNLRSQNVTSSAHGGRRYAPLVV